jgi:tRNA1(Val) A37 N6-methylase TrmN6
MKFEMKVFDSTNSNNPFLINRKDGVISDINGEKLTAEYIWSKIGKDRDNLVDYVFNYYRKNGFPFKRENNNDLFNEYNKIKEKDPTDILNKDGYIVNSSSSGTNIVKHFMGELFYSTKGAGKSKSCLDVFNDDILFRDVLKNRMGYRTTKEDGTVRPYVFAISDDMILQGMRSSGLGFSTSSFKTMVAKYIYNTYAGIGSRVLDYSSGWGNRALAAGSLDIYYTGIDPLTYSKVNDMMKFFNIKGEVLSGCSENNELYHNLGMYDFIFSSPPFFNLEVYNDAETQSYNKYKNYESWIKNYWENTVKNCCDHLKIGGRFAVCMVDKLGKFNIGNDIFDVCKKYMEADNIIPIKVCKSHLSGKKESGNITKTTEKLYILKKLNNI